MIRCLLQDFLYVQDFELGVALVGETRIAELNEQWLKHHGPTDVIAFSYGDDAPEAVLRGDLFVCVPVAVEQANRFRTTWQKEILRYIIHGLLHLRGHDDHDPLKRRTMKREENRLLKELTLRFNVGRIARSVTGENRGRD
jgi:probable rRNA maturation factor